MRRANEVCAKFGGGTPEPEAERFAFAAGQEARAGKR